jgi:hypothetical protein
MRAASPNVASAVSRKAGRLLWLPSLLRRGWGRFVGLGAAPLIPPSGRGEANRHYAAGSAAGCGTKPTVAALMLLPVCWIARRPSGQQTPVVLAMVRQAQISGDDVSYRVAVEKAYGNVWGTDGVALVALVNDALEHDVARRWKVDGTPNEVAVLSKHVDETARAPEILAKVKDTFGNDRAACERLYLGPRIVNRKLRTLFSRNAEIHARERALIEQAHSLAPSGVPLAEAAQACDLHYSTIEFWEGHNSAPALLRQHLPHSGESSKGPLSGVVATMAEGEIYKDIVEDDRCFMMIRLVQRNENQYTVEAVTAGKQSCDARFREQAVKIELAILDSESRNTILSEHPNVGWVRRWPAHPKTGDK